MATNDPETATEAAEIEVDSNFLSNNEFSDYESGYETETTSLKSSVLDYIYENGRRYHRYSQGSYVLPNDETEQDRLDMQHHFLLLLLDGRLHLAPLKNPQNILDVGTGTGIWALDMAETYPSAKVIGTDLSPIQPKWVIPNCKFEIDDAEMDWTYPADHFDLIHSRNLAQSIRDWPRYLSQIYKHTKPGGYIQLAEGEPEFHADDGSYPKDCALRTYCNRTIEGLEKMGLPLQGTSLATYARDAGFVDIEFHAKKLPAAPWASNKKMKDIGMAVYLNLQTAFIAYGLAVMTRVLEMDVEKAEEICESAKKNLANKNIHVYFYTYYLVARKPLKP